MKGLVALVSRSTPVSVPSQFLSKKASNTDGQINEYLRRQFTSIMSPAFYGESIIENKRCKWNWKRITRGEKRRNEMTSIFLRFAQCNYGLTFERLICRTPISGSKSFLGRPDSYFPLTGKKKKKKKSDREMPFQLAALSNAISGHFFAIFLPFREEIYETMSCTTCKPEMVTCNMKIR